MVSIFAFLTCGFATGFRLYLDSTELNSRFQENRMLT